MVSFQECDSATGRDSADESVENEDSEGNEAQTLQLLLRFVTAGQLYPTYAFVCDINQFDEEVKPRFCSATTRARRVARNDDSMASRKAHCW
jgi:hypothetical protein